MWWDQLLLNHVVNICVTNHNRIKIVTFFLKCSLKRHKVMSSFVPQKRNPRYFEQISDQKLNVWFPEIHVKYRTISLWDLSMNLVEKLSPTNRRNLCPLFKVSAVVDEQTQSEQFSGGTEDVEIGFFSWRFVPTWSKQPFHKLDRNKPLFVDLPRLPFIRSSKIVNAVMHPNQRGLYHCFCNLVLDRFWLFVNNSAGQFNCTKLYTSYWSTRRNDQESRTPYYQGDWAS